LSGSDAVDSWREESVNDIEKRRRGRYIALMALKNNMESGTYVVQSVETGEVVVEGDVAIEKGDEQQWRCQLLESCWNGVGSARDGEKRGEKC